MDARGRTRTSDDGPNDDGPDSGRFRRRAGTVSAVKLAVVVQRYGADINGGAELHARYVAEHLAQHADVAVLTTCARDYVTWRDDYPPGTEQVNGVPVRRFPVDHERDVQVFGRWSDRVFDHQHSHLDEMKWLDAEGPKSTALLRHLRSADAGYDYFFFFSYRYYHSYHGAKALPSRAILVPTAERDEAIGLAIVAAYLPRRARADVQQPRRAAPHPGGLEQPRRAGRGGRHRLRDSAQAAGRSLSAEVRHYGPLRALCGAHRSEQGLQRTVHVFSARPCRRCRRGCGSC